MRRIAEVRLGSSHHARSHQVNCHAIALLTTFKISLEKNWGRAFAKHSLFLKTHIQPIHH
ncbi:hypothetical protein [Cylindrospermopsis raciborskii]|uniref:hypothetical protein n=1 Tax=Cylindrospermopsis raciborskii TaxID=77022 RepID=UPI001177CF40|nr:hypothetical protein [Cylindrospermopsis raciborskii]